MADDSELTLKEKGGGKKKLIIIVALAVILLGGGGGAAWFFLGGGGEKPTEAKEAEAEPAKPDPKTLAPLYVAMPRPFVFNVAGKTRDRLVQIKVDLLVRGNPNEALAKQHIPLIEGTLLRVFSAATAEQLVTFEGKEKLRKDSLDECQKVLTELTKESVVDQVLFTGFVMQ
ncbi:flagellar FliL protein [Aeromonas sp. RU39B]|uniref:flagellar basal body-associated protein FliL n=1 Tax=Aeromonas sp. RU39B TaxID=1907416 RepID=UPI000956895B|nr:flagellar basal body-associated protein FliL [Aeromonas sp. RU39B]SIR08576.1 flagellar FliL protein [Aeromonas sp. RU39B]